MCDESTLKPLVKMFPVMTVVKLHLVPLCFSNDQTGRRGGLWCDNTFCYRCHLLDVGFNPRFYHNAVTTTRSHLPLPPPPTPPPTPITTPTWKIPPFRGLWAIAYSLTVTTDDAVVVWMDAQIEKYLISRASVVITIAESEILTSMCRDMWYNTQFTPVLISKSEFSPLGVTVVYNPHKIQLPIKMVYKRHSTSR